MYVVPDSKQLVSQLCPIPSPLIRYLGTNNAFERTSQLLEIVFICCWDFALLAFACSSSAISGLLQQMLNNYFINLLDSFYGHEMLIAIIQVYPLT